MGDVKAVEATMLLHVTDSDGRRAPVIACARYEANDPYAVVFSFKTGAPEPIEWVFARELLTAGLAATRGNYAGDGDVKVWVDVTPAGPIVKVSLTSGEGQVVFEAVPSDVIAFLAASWIVVAPGEESNEVNFDSELQSILLGGSWRGA